MTTLDSYSGATDAKNELLKTILSKRMASYLFQQQISYSRPVEAILGVKEHFNVQLIKS